MNLLVHQNQIIDVLEDECNMLQNLSLNMRKESLYTALNNRVSDAYTQEYLQEDETIHQLTEPMEIK
jgi:hypothetical protein